MGCENSKDAFDVGIPQAMNVRTCKSIRYLTGLVKSKRKNQNVKDLSPLITENVEQISSRISGEDLLLVKKAISEHFLFYMLTEEQRLALIQQMKHYQSFKNTHLFQKGDEGTIFFIIAEGKVSIDMGKNTKKILQKGHSFGELALIYSAPRSSSVFCKTDCKFWGLDNQTFRKFLSKITKHNYEFIKSYIQNFPIFDFLNQKEKDRLIFNSHRFKYKAGKTIFRKNDPSNSIFIIVNGRVEMKIPNKPKIQYQKKQIFGEGCLTGDKYRSGTAVCMEDTECLAISKQILVKEFEFQADHILFYCISKWGLKRSTIFNLFKKNTIDKILQAAKYFLYEDGELIQDHQTPSQTVYICLQGKINDDGIGAIFNDNPFQISSKDLIKRGRGYVFACPYSLLDNILKQPFRKIIEGKQRVMKTLKKVQKASINDYMVVHKLQETDLGQILLVKDIRMRNRYKAVQLFNKKQVIKNQKELGIHNYLQTLKNMKTHPLIPQIDNFYSLDQDFLYIVRNSMSGISLLDLIEDHNLDELTSQYYVACMIQILQHLHNENILHRNIKPQNFHLTIQGRICAFDLSSMKKVLNNSATGGRTFTIMGSPHYMAPQTMQSKGYSFPADIWSLGVTVYEIFFGMLPFAAHLDDPIEIYNQIKRSHVIFPHHYKNVAGINLIKSMLHPCESMRETLQNLKEMSYFNNFCFEKMMEDCSKAPGVILKGSKITNMLSLVKQNMSQLLIQHVEKKKLALAQQSKSKKYPTWDNFL